MSDDYETQLTPLTSRFENLFRNPPPELSAQILSTIKSNPGVASAEALASSLLSVVEENPKKSESLILPIAHILPATADIVINDEDAGYNDYPFDHVFVIRLSELLSDTLHETQLHVPKQTVVSPQNTVLAAALFSASAIQHELLNSNHIYAFARQGLQLPDATIEEERKEVVAIGACLQLLVAGNIMKEKWLALSDGLEKVVAALESLKDKNVIKYPKAMDLLEVNFIPPNKVTITKNAFQKTITEAKGNFSTPLAPAAAWGLLFPS